MSYSYVKGIEAILTPTPASFDAYLTALFVSMKVLMAAFGYYSGRAKMFKMAQEIIYYWSGLISVQGRLKYEQATTKHRPYEQMQKYNEMREMMARPAAKDNFIYNSYSIALPESVIRGLNRAADERGPVPIEELTEAAVRARLSQDQYRQNAENGAYADDPYRLFSVDQILFFDDQTLEPVLVNFVRIKDTFKKPSRKPKEQKVEASRTEPGFAGDEAPSAAFAVPQK
jgi:hypothetical protein